MAGDDRVQEWEAIKARLAASTDELARRCVTASLIFDEGDAWPLFECFDLVAELPHDQAEDLILRLASIAGWILTCAAAVEPGYADAMALWRELQASLPEEE
jgi:hypothetical protein